jgi:uncharacterized protein (TIGR04255 family)
MSNQLAFPNPPITEALLDIRVNPRPGIDYEALDPFCDQISAQYPTRRFRKEWTGEVGISEDGHPYAGAPQGGVVGYLATSAHGNQVAQARVSGFSFSWLKPYRDWATMRDEARRLWDMYVSVAEPIAIERIALRYINRLELPLPFGDFKEYVRTAPDIAPGLPQELSNFLMQLQIPCADERAIVILTETIEKPIGDARSLPFVLDIDAFRQERIVPTDLTLWDKFEVLHTLKNRFFFESVTDKAKELFL